MLTSILVIFILQFLPPAYVVRREGNVFSLFVCSQVVPRGPVSDPIQRYGGYPPGLVSGPVCRGEYPQTEPGDIP